MSDRSHGADRDWLLRFAPAEQRLELAALFTIESELTDSLRYGIAHEVAHARLAWWQEELERLACSVPRHPAARLLAAQARARGSSPPDLRALIEHAQIMLATVAFLTRTELDEFLAHWASSVFRAATGHAFAEAERLAHYAGPRVRELELLSDFSRHAQRGRIFTPLGAPPAEHAPWSAVPLARPERAALVARRSALVGELRGAAANVAADLRPLLRTPLLWMSFVVDRALRAPDDFSGDRDNARPRRLEPWRRTMFAWRTALAISRGRLPSTLVA